ncbi:MAG: hypothetical protein AAF293_06020 [Pseudomonadota bacterium]
MKTQLRAFGPPRSYSVNAFIGEAKKYISDVKDSLGLFETGFQCGGAHTRPRKQVSAMMDDFDQAMFDQMFVGDQTYKDADGNKSEYSLNSIGPNYICRFDLPDLSLDDPQYIGLSMHGDGFAKPSPQGNLIMWEFHPDGEGHPLSNYQGVRSLLETTVQHRKPDLANCTTHAFRRATGYDRKLDKFDIGWLTYFNDPAYGKAVEGVAETERLGDGVLIRVCDDFRQIEHPDVIARGSRVRQALMRAGLLIK